MIKNFTRSTSGNKTTFLRTRVAHSLCNVIKSVASLVNPKAKKEGPWKRYVAFYWSFLIYSLKFYTDMQIHVFKSIGWGFFWNSVILKYPQALISSESELCKAAKLLAKSKHLKGPNTFLLI